MVELAIIFLGELKLANPFLTIDHLLNTGDVDFKKQMKISTMLYFFQEIAVKHATLMGVGFDEMQSKGMFWVLAKIKIKIHAFPNLDDKIIIKSWPKPSRFAMYTRDYQILDKSGNILIAASSVWCILNTSDHSLYKGESPIPPMEYLTENAIADRLKHISLAEEFQNAETLLFKKTIRYSDVDYNMHFNNTRFGEIVMDCFSLDFLSENTIDTVQINFNNEGKIGDELFTYFTCNDKTFTILSKNRTQNNDTLEAEVVFK